MGPFSGTLESKKYSQQRLDGLSLNQNHLFLHGHQNPKKCWQASNLGESFPDGKEQRNQQFFPKHNLYHTCFLIWKANLVMKIGWGLLLQTMLVQAVWPPQSPKRPANDLATLSQSTCWWSLSGPIQTVPFGIQDPCLSGSQWSFSLLHHKTLALVREIHTIFIPSSTHFFRLPALPRLFSTHWNCTNIYKCQLIHEDFHSNSNNSTLHSQHTR